MAANRKQARPRPAPVSSVRTTRRDQRRRLVAALVAAAVVVLGLVSLVGGGSGTDDAVDVDTSGPGTDAAPRPVTLSPVAAGATVTGATPCPAADGSSPRTTSFAGPPPMCIDPTRDYVAAIVTSKGTITVDLDPAAAPRTVNNFVVLARYSYFDGIPFHRVVPGFVIQVGDPQASGRGGPGYRFEDELPPAGAYRVGSVAMANSGADTNGSQFFIVTGPEGVALAPNYSLFGQVVAGTEVVSAIEAIGIETGVPGHPDNGKVTEVVTLNSVTITER